jgi:acyl-CoA synthetase (NDP forming)
MSLDTLHSAPRSPLQGPRLGPLLAPRSIAILGASDRPSLSQAVLRSLGTLGYEGPVFPVNPKYERILDYPCYASLDDLPETPDLVAFCVGSRHILANLEIAAARGVRAAVIYDGGFAEKGAEGLALQRSVADLCAQASIALCGPNCMGILNPHHRSSTYTQELCNPDGLAGNVGLVSQSGSICIGMLGDVRRFGFSLVVSSGNEAVVPMADYIEALIDDPHTAVIGLFIESVREPERFVAALDRAAAAGKPVVVLKVGRSERTQRAITSHTGGLAGSSRVFSEVLRTHRAIETLDLDEFTEVLAACQGSRWPTGPRLGVITGSGGQAELILDIASASGPQLPPLPQATREAVEEVVGPITGDGNPLDAWGNGNFKVNFTHALRVLDQSPSCDVVLMTLDVMDGQPMERPERHLGFMDLLIEAAGRSEKPHYLLTTRRGIMMRDHIDLLKRHGISIIGGIRQGLAALDRLAHWSMAAHARPRLTTASPLKNGLASLGTLAGRSSINEFDAKRVLAAEGLPVSAERFVLSLAEAHEAADEIGYPVVLKAVSDEIAHKSDLGLVMVDLRDSRALAAAWEEMARRAAAAASEGKVLGFLVQEMIRDGIEVFAGINRDPDFGLVLAFGLGGVAIEILQDVSLRMLPLVAGDAAAMVGEIKGAALLHGARGAPSCDIDALIRCLEDFARYAWADRESIAEIDLNPIKVREHGKGCRIVDALIVPRKQR